MTNLRPLALIPGFYCGLLLLSYITGKPFDWEAFKWECVAIFVVVLCNFLIWKN